jgi:ribosomal-protein-serine acetyltransferase
VRLIHDLGDGVHLRLLEEADADDQFALIDREREHLAPWMPWIPATTSPADSLEFIRMTRRQVGENDGLQMAIVVDGALAGMVGFHRIDRLNRSTTMGYWLAAGHQGRGIMTTAVRSLVDHAFEVWDLHRIELMAAVENARSRAVAERCGFREEGVRRGAERHGDAWLDLVVYGLLRTDPR